MCARLEHSLIYFSYFLRTSVELYTVKNVVLTGFGDITLLDLDTIDLSNLNRQFLFRKNNIKQPKAIVSSPTYIKTLFQN